MMSRVIWRVVVLIGTIILIAVALSLSGCAGTVRQTPDGPVYEGLDFWGSRRVVVANNQSCHALDISMEGLMRKYGLPHTNAFNAVTNLGYSDAPYLVEVWRVDPITRKRVSGYASRHFSFSHSGAGSLSWEVTDATFSGQPIDPGSSCAAAHRKDPPAPPYQPERGQQQQPPLQYPPQYPLPQQVIPPYGGVAPRQVFVVITSNFKSPVSVRVYDIQQGSGRGQFLARGLTCHHPPVVYPMPADNRTWVFEAVGARRGEFVDTQTLTLGSGSPNEEYFVIGRGQRDECEEDRRRERERDRRPDRDRPDRPRR